jgi:hypothetical protein
VLFSMTAVAAPASPPDHVVIAIMENHSYSSIIGSSDAPYINSLVAGSAVMTSSHAITHPSEPNYLWLFSGSNQGVTSDTCSVGPFATDNLGSLLIGASFTFTGYSEDLPSAGNTMCTSGEYARKHNPWSFFSNLAPTTNQPFSAFPADFTTLPTVSFVVPNLIDDMHDGTIAEGDAWLQTNVDPYVQWAKTHNSLFVLTWDEDDGSQSNQILTLFAGEPVTPGSYAQSINHLSVLRTIEDLYGLDYAGSSGSATPIPGIFTDCGNGTVEGPEECDSSTVGCNPGQACQSCLCVEPQICSSGKTLFNSSISLAANPFAFHLAARANLPAPLSGVDPPTLGLRVRIDSPDGNGFDVTLPGGAAWTTKGTRWTYSDPDGNVGGITKAIVTDESAKTDGQVKVVIKGKGGSIVIPALSELRATVVFGSGNNCAVVDAGSATISCSGDTSKTHCR